MHSSISISIVVPVYSGEAYLRRLVTEVDAARASLILENAPFAICELVLVDDNAIDGSAVLMDQLAAEYSWVTALHLSRNFGQHPACMAGILHTSGDWVVTMDEDLQHPPSAIPDLMAVVARTGADIVYGRPKSAVHQSMFRDFSSRNYKSAIKRLTGNPNIGKANSFRLVRGAIGRAASSVCGHDTYFDIALGWFTQRVESLPLDLKDERFIQTGRSGYRFKSLISHARRMAFSSQIKLLRFGAVFGMAMLAFSSITGVVLVIQRLVAPASIDSPGWTSIMLAICFFSGLTLFLIGVMLEYMAILVMQAHGRPLYFAIDRSSDALLKRPGATNPA